MRISHRALPAIRLVVLFLFVVLCGTVFCYLWLSSGGKLPVLSKAGYQVSFSAPKVTNLVYDSDVMIAGVKVGKVDQLDVKGNRARVTVQLDEAHPLHKGASVQIRNKTMVEETFVEITDGRGGELPSGSTLPPKAAKPAVTLNDVLASIGGDTRQALASSLRSLGAGTKGSRQHISAALGGLGKLGREGGTAVDALAAQSDDLRQLSGNAATLLAALDSRQGQIAQMVRNANTLTKATAGGAGQLREVLRKFPPLLENARTASGGLNKLSSSLSPVAANLRKAGPGLSAALRELPETSAELRGLLPALNGVLDDAPNTLRRVPGFSGDVRALVPDARTALSDVNPMLSYLRPYGKDIAGYFANFAQVLSTGDVNGLANRIRPVLNENSIKGNPLNTNAGPLDKFNPYPRPGANSDPGPDHRPYPRVQREGK